MLGETEEEFDAQQDKTTLKDLEEIDELSGKLEQNTKEQKLMHSVLENDTQTIEDGKLVNNAINMNLSSFTPDLMFEHLVKNYKTAKKLFGESLIQKIGGYNPQYIEKNIQIPEFREQLKKNIQSSVERLKEKDVLDKDGNVTETGIKLASVINYIEEIQNLIPRGVLGEKVNKKENRYGVKNDTLPYNKDRSYSDLATRATIKKAARRMHKRIIPEDLMVYEKEAKGNIQVIYGIDASGSMKGDKIDMSKRAGIALAYQAIKEKDSVGILVFGKEVKTKIYPTQDFSHLLHELTTITASDETNIAQTIDTSIEMFSRENITKHLLLITDAMPTVGNQPLQDALDAAERAANHKITISVVGIRLNEESSEFAEQLVTIGKGRFYGIQNVDSVDKIILQDYYSL